jgi:hypothetical protein
MRTSERTIHRPPDARRDQATSLCDSQKSICPCRTKRSALSKYVLLIALVIVPIGCDGKVRNKFSVPENPAPRPDPSSRLELGESANTPVAAGSQEHSAENSTSAPRKSEP